MSSTTETKIEYGVRGALDVWPDEDGELYLGGYVNAVTDGESEADVADLRRRLAQENARFARSYVLVSRTITIDAAVIVEDPLPTAFGSLIRASRDGSDRVLLTLADPKDVGMEWRSESGSWVSTRSLSEIEVLFNAKEVAA